MGYLFIEEYHSYKNTGDSSYGEVLSATFFNELTLWIDSGRPNEFFLDEFWDLYTHIQDSDAVPVGDLIDLGIMQTAEAINYYHQEDLQGNPLDFYLHEARWPFLAYIDQNGYRTIKSEDFSEIDFYIFDIIEGDFPHEAARDFLIKNEWADIWTTLRYLDTIPDSSERYDLINQILSHKETVHEKLIIIAYLVFTESDYMESLTEEGLIHLPSDIDIHFIYYIYNLLDSALYGHPLSVDWESRIKPEYQNFTLFFLLAFFEISQTEISPGWIRVIEKSLETIWNYPVPAGELPMYNHQPLQDFATSILLLLTPEELNEVLETSLIYPIFFQNLEHYNMESFENIMGVLIRHEDLMMRELSSVISNEIAIVKIPEFIEGAYQDIARYLGCEIRVIEESLQLWGPEGIII